MEVEQFNMKAKTYEGLEDVLGRELMRIGAEDVNTELCTVTFSGDKYLLYRANYELRTALKIYREILKFEFSTKDEFYNALKDYRWSKILNIYKSYSVESIVKCSAFENDENINENVSKIINDYFNLKSKKTPPKDSTNPAVKIVFEITDNSCEMMLDAGGTSLSDRGFGLQSGTSKINEVYAAGLIQLSGWKSFTNLCDPICSSGLILMEAAMYAYNIPAQVCRETFGFFTWRDFDTDLWQRIKNEARLRIKHNGEIAFKIFGYDISEPVVKAAQQNIKKALLDKYITVSVLPIDKIELPKMEANTLIINPSATDYKYKPEETQRYFEQLGKNLKRNFKGVKTWIHSNYPDLNKTLGMQPIKEISIFNGLEECKFSLFEVYN